MSNFKFKLKGYGRGMQELMKRDSVVNECMKKAKEIQARCGPGYEVGVRHYKERNGVAVYPGDDDAYYDNLANNTIEKASR